MTGTPESTNTLQEAALAALQRGWSVLPVQVSGEWAKKPAYVLVDTGHSEVKDGKTVPAWKGLQTTRPTPTDVTTWFARPNGKGLALVTGSISGVVVIDFDGPAGEALREQLGLPVHVRTGSGGSHVYFEHPGWPVTTLNGKAKEDLGKQWPGLDIRGDGGYAVIPPSRNASGPYTWLGRPGEMLPLDRLPEDLRAFLGLLEAPRPSAPRNTTPSTSYTGQRRDGSGRPPAELLLGRALDQVNAGEGRNNAGAEMVMQLRDNGYSEGEAWDVMREYVARVPQQDAHGRQDPYTEGAARATLRSIYTRPARDPWEDRRPAPSSGPTSVLASAPRSEGAPPSPVAETGDGPVVLTGDTDFARVDAALAMPHAENAVARRSQTADDLRTLLQDGRPVFALAPTHTMERTLDAAGVEWYALPRLSVTATGEQLLEELRTAMADVWGASLAGSQTFLQEELLALADARLNRGGAMYPTGLAEFDEAIGGGFYDGLHVLGGVTGGGKTALALAIAEGNARAGRPVLYVTYEQSRYELWSRMISTRTGIAQRHLRSGGTPERPVSADLQINPQYIDLIENVAPSLTVIEGDGFDGGSWGVDRIAAQVRRLKAAHDGRAPLVILDYLQRMPSGSEKDKRHQVDDIVMGLQVRLGRELHAPLLLISSVGRGKYGELATMPLEERLSVFKESGGVEYTAYTATLLYPLGAQNIQALGLEAPPLPGSSRAALKGLWKYLVLDLAKNREGEAPCQWVVRWYPVRGTFELVQALDPEALGQEVGSVGRRASR
ncbi:bifunctional DNA primase/polymerase [Deinococcus metalli]|uniref:SF4 helicase domain-containing protein n=1 Tax=Deinococcus metalli TaxID=1141878 RepID=A0ABQ3JXY0_9DEIO|nr:hypothetical protein GCM10017781_46310 [Deinococcus metalli]